MKKHVIFAMALSLLVGPAVGLGQVAGPGNFNPAGRNNMAVVLRQQLAVTNDDVWKVLEPRIQKVVDDQQALRTMTGRGGYARRGGNQTAAVSPAIQQVRDAVAALSAALQDPNAPVDELEAKGNALRQAREKAQAELEADQKSLRDLLTVRQEMVLVAMGYLN